MPKARLLIVEDDAHLLMGLRDILELDDYAVMTAENGKQALHILQRDIEIPPDLIVSDIMMPVMDGLEFLRTVRQQDEWVNIPFIFLTAKGEKADIQQGKVLGVDDYLVKPFDADDLLIAVEARLKRHRAIHRVQSTVISSLKRNILTILNHEFRTPLTLVVAYADMLKDYEIEEMTPAQLVEFLRGVNSGAERLRRLIENFILLVELEAGDADRTYDWRKHRIDNVGQILTTVHHNFTNSDSVQHPVYLELGEPLPSIMGDHEFLAAAVRELVDNAIKFSERGQPVTIGAAHEDDDLLIWVQDRGRGIAASEIALIWDSFYQIKREVHEDQGAGSGLAIVKGVTRLHGGVVCVDSEPQVGSRFTIKLPIIRTAG